MEVFISEVGSFVEALFAPKDVQEERISVVKVGLIRESLHLFCNDLTDYMTGQSFKSEQMVEIVVQSWSHGPEGVKLQWETDEGANLVRLCTIDNLMIE